jgi:hypothetical protein
MNQDEAAGKWMQFKGKSVEACRATLSCSRLQRVLTPPMAIWILSSTLPSALQLGIAAV